MSVTGDLKINRNQATDMAQNLLKQYGSSQFDVSLGNAEDYEMMKRTFEDLGCKTEPDGELFILRVLAR
jgi:hypothetical protein